MNIFKISELDESGKVVASPSPLMKFFLQVKKDKGITWKQNNEFKVIGTQNVLNEKTQDSKTTRTYEKKFIGNINNSHKSTTDFQAVLRVNCIVIFDDLGEEEIGMSEYSATLVLSTYATNGVINKWVIFPDNAENSTVSNNSDIEFKITQMLTDTLGMGSNLLEMPSQFQKKQIQKNKPAPSITIEKVINGKKIQVYDYERLTRVKSNKYPSTSLELYIRKPDTFKPKFAVAFITNYLEIGESDKETVVEDNANTYGEAKAIFEEAIKGAKTNKGYVDKSSSLYLPEGVTRHNWDFVLHKWKIDPNAKTEEVTQDVPQEPVQQQPIQPIQPIQQVKEQPQPQEQPKQPFVKPKNKLNFKKLLGQSQDFAGYFTGDVPDIAGEYIGTSSVDASQISGMFGGTNEAIQLVNNYSDALQNVAYIFNFSKGGAYGVYIPALDRAIKTKALKKQLEQKGYSIKEENGMLTANPTKEDIPQETVEKDINDLWEQLNASGGAALGINMSDVLRATHENTSSIVNAMRSDNPNVPPQIEQILNDVLGVYHLAAIIVHEAAHTKGGDEGAAESAEGAFRTWAHGYLNKQYQSKLSSAGLQEFYRPLEMGNSVLHASSKRDWYKSAQNYMPQGGMSPARGSDIGGRYHGKSQDGAFAEWAMMVQQDQSIPIEKRLNRGQMAELERDVDQENDIIEEQLRKQFRNDSRPNVLLLTEELLAPDHDISQSYKAMETLLEERRPKPLMVPIQKAAALMTKESIKNSLFGWYNNLDLDDGSTIPGLSDRVMAWDDRDESFAGEEKTIKEQERYNPEYDLKGFYFRWIEPRFKPELFDDMTKDLVNTSPAKRFAGTIDPTLTRMLSVMKLIEDSIINEKIKATRIVVTSDLMDLVKKIMDKEGLKIKAYPVAESEDSFSIWVYGNSVSETDLDKAEQYFQNLDGSNQFKGLVDDLLGGKSMITSAAEEIVNIAKNLCDKNNIDDLYIIGEYARKMYVGETKPFVTELDFVCESTDSGLKIGSILSNKLNIASESVIISKMGITFVYKGIRVFFSKSKYLSEIGRQMQKQGYDCSSAVLREICNRDFTINMMAYNVKDGKIVDPVGAKSDVKNQIVKTLFDANFIVAANPMVIMRAISFKLDGYEIDEELEKSMIEGSVSLGCKFSEQRIKFVKQFLKDKNAEQAESLFEEYGLNS